MVPLPLCSVQVLFSVFDPVDDPRSSMGGEEQLSGRTRVRISTNYRSRQFVTQTCTFVPYEPHFIQGGTVAESSLSQLSIKREYLTIDVNIFNWMAYLASCLDGKFITGQLYRSSC